MKLIDGKKIADKILVELEKNIKKSQVKPGLAVILVGNNKASRIYVNLKMKAAEKIGVNFCFYKFRSSVPEKKIISKIKELNKNIKNPKNSLWL